MVRAEWLNLNGEWEFELDPGRSGEARGLAADAPYSWRIVLPFCPESRLSGIGERDFMPCVWYRRSFAVSEAWRGRRVLLHFGAADYEATVWVNGRLAGRHRGGYTPFSFDVTDLLQAGGNQVAVRVEDDTRDPLQPTGKQSMRYESYGCRYTRTTGIWQTVWLEPVAPVHVRSFRLLPDVGQGLVTVLVEAAAGGEEVEVEVRATALGSLAGRAAAATRGTACLSLALEDVRPWAPGTPFLYDLEMLVRRGGEVADRVTSYFGLREIAIRGKEVLLNGRPLFQRLVLDQGYYPDGIYTAPSDEALRRDIELAQAMGFNGARLHEKVFEPRFLYWADKLGYLCWGEYPNWGVNHAHPGALGRILPEWLEAVARDFNHAAVVGWCPFNETPRDQDPELLRAVYRATKAVDPTRPVIDTSGYVHVETDIYDCHSYQQDPAAFAALFEPFKTSGAPWRNWPDHDAAYAGQPYFVSEYGGIWWNPGQADEKGWGYGGAGARPRTEQEFLERYRLLTEVLLSHPKMFGFCYTQLYDVEQEVNGLHTYDRRPKFAPAVISAINSKRAAVEGGAG